jgi:pimeloyl-ACP methyl ester carboxylesterase
MQISDTPYPLPIRYLETEAGISLAYVEVGQGVPLLFLHGLGSYGPAWQKNMAYLSPHFRCLALDLPGFGKSGKERVTPGMGYYAGVVREFLDRLGIAACYLIGHSMGGQVALHTALRYPERIKKLSLMAPAGLETFSPAEARQLQDWFVPEKMMEAPLATVEKNVRANFHHFPPDAQQLLEDRLRYTRCTDYPLFCQTLSRCVSAMIEEPVYDQLPQLQMPVQIIFGRQDRYIPSPLIHPGLVLEEMVQEAAARIPQADVCFLEECGHFVQWERAEEVNGLLMKFFRNDGFAKPTSAGVSN